MILTILTYFFFVIITSSPRPIVFLYKLFLELELAVQITRYFTFKDTKKVTYTQKIAEPKRD